MTASPTAADGLVNTSATAVNAECAEMLGTCLRWVHTPSSEKILFSSDTSFNILRSSCIALTKHLDDDGDIFPNIFFSIPTIVFVFLFFILSVHRVERLPRNWERGNSFFGLNCWLIGDIILLYSSILLNFSPPFRWTAPSGRNSLKLLYTHLLCLYIKQSDRARKRKRVHPLLFFFSISILAPYRWYIRYCYSDELWPGGLFLVFFLSFSILLFYCCSNLCSWLVGSSLAPTSTAAATVKRRLSARTRRTLASKLESSWRPTTKATSSSVSASTT